MRALLIFGLFGGVLAACSTSAPPVGTERGACASDHTCSGGLVCLSDLCVRPPAGDCSQVAEALASVKLGNYATPEARAPVVSEIRTKCDHERISVDDAKCLTAAKSKYEMARCPHPLLPELVELGKDTGGCKAVGARMEEMSRAEMSKDPNDPIAKLLPQLVEAVIASCDQDGWPPEVKDCIAHADASDSHAADRCIERMPPATRDKFMKRIQTILDGATKQPPPPPPPAALPPPTAP